MAAHSSPKTHDVASSWCCTVASAACSAALSALVPAAWAQGRCAFRVAASCHSSSALTTMSAHAVELSCYSSPRLHKDNTPVNKEMGRQPAMSAPTAMSAGNPASQRGVQGYREECSQHHAPVDFLPHANVRSPNTVARCKILQNKQMDPADS